jgi:hypothetical protein
MAFFPVPGGSTGIPSISSWCCMSRCFQDVWSGLNPWPCCRCRTRKAAMIQCLAWRSGTRCIRTSKRSRRYPHIFPAKLNISLPPTSSWSSSLFRVLAGPMSRRPTRQCGTRMRPMGSPQQQGRRPQALSHQYPVGDGRSDPVSSVPVRVSNHREVWCGNTWRAGNAPACLSPVCPYLRPVCGGGQTPVSPLSQRH